MLSIATSPEGVKFVVSTAKFEDGWETLVIRVNEDSRLPECGDSECLKVWSRAGMIDGESVYVGELLCCEICGEHEHESILFKIEDGSMEFMSPEGVSKAILANSIPEVDSELVNDLVKVISQLSATLKLSTLL